ncbi:hypothetical protein K5I29_01950 [Flavobacterium agricola]|uniref:Uncharacterized protein n=1 Tax=Flavobacterium agricola TaxID=2870839 RepID=A0ABY6M1Z6_9FLAO|nr:hypothetical protein K5I29_01950 [Flavobacterium agricola]
MVLPWLEQMALHYNITNVYQAFEDIEDFETCLHILLREDKNYKAYNLLYFVVPGANNQIEINNYFYSFEEVAELFEGKLQDKIVHFANTFALDIDEEDAQYFLDITGALGLSGYGFKAPVLSTALDGFYFNLCQTYHDPVALVENLFEQKYTLCKALDFRFYY